MIGVALSAIATLADEFCGSVEKYRITNRSQSVYATGFILNIVGIFLIVLIAALLPESGSFFGFTGGFSFSSASLPTFIPRIVLEIAQAHVGILALVYADRSTFGFLRTLTIPLLLVVDRALGYMISLQQIFGIAVIALSLLILFLNHGLKKKGAWLVLFASVNAVVTISLYKYDITHFNSVGAEQGAIYAVLIAYFLILSVFIARENPLKLLYRPIYLIQMLLSGISNVAISFAYVSAPASVITAAKRALAVLWAVLSGRIYFHEKNLYIKLACFALVIIGIYLLIA